MTADRIDINATINRDATRVQIYISSGRLNGFYTLRRTIVGAKVYRDNYIRTLSTDPDKAEALAKDYFERVSRGDPQFIYLGMQADELDPHGTNNPLKVWERVALRKVADGVIPFGKNEGARFDAQDDGWLMFWHRKVGAAENTPVFEAVACAASGVAHERGLIEAYKARAAAVEARKAASQYVGTVGERMAVNAAINYTTGFETAFGYMFVTIMSDANGNTLVYKGSRQLGAEGDRVKMQAAVKHHDERKGEKQTVLARPTKIEIIRADAPVTALVAVLLITSAITYALGF
jgi:hypothetical protein